ncbi:tetratricopeptide repeat protein [Roseiconus nitratireducens]|uniref:Tetratricopeptide repeat protein n=1 Tax=Roseiconus nitratireducens TaxID=2605748 RepID=A0A5M6D424_9BACT|nr:tetratricopeptide repeat protein [Roseiconus nitratireducens]KAA5540489.1 tetratricopeptide repeat protein [Roseiconus nitratireducens]
MKSNRNKARSSTGNVLGWTSTSLLLLSLGCTSVTAPGGAGPGGMGRWWPGWPSANSQGPQGSAADVAETSEPVDDRPLVQRIPTPTRLVGYVTGKAENTTKAKELYRKGDAIFRQAQNASEKERIALFGKAADHFADAGDAAPGSALQQDALYMQGESLFFANDLNGARDAFETLQKEFPRNRHSDRVAARLFTISQYWIETSKAGADAWYKVNLFDKTRPLMDHDGHAVKVLDQIRYDDPTGKLADDATMAAAAEHIRNERYEQADEFLTDLRETFTDSNHQFLAHMLGIRCKLEIYAGPQYGERVLEEAADLVDQTRQRFPAELREQKYADILARAAAEIEFHQAEKLAFRARLRGKQREFGASREIYRKLLRDFPNTPQAEEAREALAEIDGLPDSPTQKLAFLTKLFPDSKQSTPLETVQSQSGDDASEPDTESNNGTILR